MNNSTLDELFGDTPDDLDLGPEEITDWIDLAPAGSSREAIRLFRMTDTELVEIGKQLFVEIKESVSPRTIGKMFLLTYNLRDHRDQHVFSDISPHLSSPDTQIDLHELSDTPISVISREPPAIFRANQLKINELSNAFCYLAASYLRLYTKNAENYSRVVSMQLKERYESVFRVKFPIENYHLSVDALNAIKIVFESMKCTFYNLLHAGEETAVGDSLKNYLYRVHISYTGLHSLVLFTRCMDIYKVDHFDLLNVLNRPEFKTEISSLIKVFENFYTEEAKRSKKMWKYARIFNHRFLSSLQTKRCQLFTATLAYLIRNSSAANEEANRNVLNIVQIRDLPEMPRKMAQSIAEKAARVLSNTDSGATHHLTSNMGNLRMK